MVKWMKLSNLVTFACLGIVGKLILPPAAPDKYVVFKLPPTYTVLVPLDS